jgi:hypothetical protein
LKEQTKEVLKDPSTYCVNKKKISLTLSEEFASKTEKKYRKNLEPLCLSLRKKFKVLTGEQSMDYNVCISHCIDLSNKFKEISH